MDTQFSLRSNERLVFARGCGWGAALFRVRLQQFVQVDDDIFHFGVVDSALLGSLLPKGVRKDEE